MLRNLLIGIVAAVALFAVGSSLLFDPVRGLEMRSSEADFKERLKASGALERREAKIRNAAQRKREGRSAQTSDAALAAWYGQASPDSAARAEGLDVTGTAPQKASTAPVDNSHLINDTRPFGAPMIGPDKRAASDASEAAD